MISPMKRLCKPTYAVDSTVIRGDVVLNVSDPFRRGYRASRRGFTIVDLLVSLAVMAMLMAVLLPSLSRVREASYRTQSASNIRQIGIGTQISAYDSDGLLPTSMFQDSKGGRGVDAPEQMVYIRVSADTVVNSTGRSAPKSDGNSPLFLWDGLGKLFHREYIGQGEVFYNPSHEYQFTYENYEAQFNGAPGDIVCNYHYRWDRAERRIDRLDLETTLVADAMRSQPEYSHVVGNNMLKGDLSVNWYHDKGGLLYSSLAPDAFMIASSSDPIATQSRTGVIQGWKILDSKSVQRGTATASDQVNGPVGAFFGASFVTK